jgi:carbonic anhydrase/acetyltransferase-like protein (isoleucine patch superfamily)
LPSLHSLTISIWYGATVRGDVNKVTIGDNTNIGDRTVVHVAKIQGDHPTSIGDNVTIGPCALIHAATIHNDCMIGAGAQVMDGAVVESHSILAPGSMVTPKTTVKSGELWAGSPAKKVRALTAEEIAGIGDAASDRAELAALHAIECSKDYKQLAADEELYEDMELRDEEHFPRDLQDPSDVQGQGSPGLIFNTTLSNPEEGLKMKQAQGGSK